MTVINTPYSLKFDFITLRSTKETLHKFVRIQKNINKQQITDYRNIYENTKLRRSAQHFGDKKMI